MEQIDQSDISGSAHSLFDKLRPSGEGGHTKTRIKQIMGREPTAVESLAISNAIGWLDSPAGRAYVSSLAELQAKETAEAANRSERQLSLCIPGGKSTLQDQE